MTTAVHTGTGVGELLRDWRRERRLSQLQLALEVGTSTRHLSFVETGRSRPSSEMILRLADRLEVPLRERNRLLLAGGFAPVYPEYSLDAPELQASLAAVRQVLAGHEPYPALAVDHAWNVIDTNSGLGVLLGGVAPWLLEGQVNTLRLSLHPEGMAPSIVNLGQWRGHVLATLRRNLAVSGDSRLRELYDELLTYPCDQEVPPVETPTGGGVHIPLQFRVDGRVLSFLGIISTFGTAVDVTLAELSIESLLPADADTAAYLHGRAGD